MAVISRLCTDLKMKVTTLLLGAAGAVVAYLAFFAKKLVNLKPTFNGVKVHNFDSTGLQLRINIRIQNPNSSSVKIDALNGYVATNGGSTLATFNYKESKECAGDNAFTDINNIEVTVPYATLVSTVWQYVVAKKQIPIAAQGYLTANGNKVPFVASYKLPVLSL